MNNVTDMNEFKQKSRTRYISSLLLVGFLFLSVAAADVLLIVMSPAKFVVNLILAIIITIVMVWGLIFYFSNMYGQLRFLYEASKRHSKFNESEGYFTVIEQKEIVKNKVEFKALKVSYVDGGATYTRDLLLINDVDIASDTKIKARIYQNFLIGYEVINDESN